MVPVQDKVCIFHAIAPNLKYNPLRRFSISHRSSRYFMPKKRYITWGVYFPGTKHVTGFEQLVGFVRFSFVSFIVRTKCRRYLEKKKLEGNSVRF